MNRNVSSPSRSRETRARRQTLGPFPATIDDKPNDWILALERTFGQFGQFAFRGRQGSLTSKEGTWGIQNLTEQRIVD